MNTAALKQLEQRSPQTQALHRGPSPGSAPLAGPWHLRACLAGAGPSDPQDRRHRLPPQKERRNLPERCLFKNQGRAGRAGVHLGGGLTAGVKRVSDTPELLRWSQPHPAGNLKGGSHHTAVGPGDIDRPDPQSCCHARSQAQGNPCSSGRPVFPDKGRRLCFEENRGHCC